MVSPGGVMTSGWHGDWAHGEGFYRLGKGQRVSAHAVDQAVLDAIFTQMQSDQVVKKLMAEVSARARVFVPQKKSGWVETVRIRQNKRWRKLCGRLSWKKKVISCGCI